MLIADIIAYARLKADIPNTNFYLDTEAMRDLNASWRDIYAILMENNDDYFVNDVTFDMISTQPVVGHDGVFNYILPVDFYRLRLLQYNNNGTWYPCTKMTFENLGNSQTYPAYRITNNKLFIYDKSGVESYYFWYYPAPQTWLLTDYLLYPLNVITEIMSYQIAAEIKRKQSLDPAPMIQRRNELINSMVKDLKRDDFKNEKVRNVYSTGFNPYR